MSLSVLKFIWSKRKSPKELLEKMILKRVSTFLLENKAFFETAEPMRNTASPRHLPADENTDISSDQKGKTKFNCYRDLFKQNKLENRGSLTETFLKPIVRKISNANQTNRTKVPSNKQNTRHLNTKTQLEIQIPSVTDIFESNITQDQRLRLIPEQVPIVPIFQDEESHYFRKSIQKELPDTSGGHKFEYELAKSPQSTKNQAARSSVEIFELKLHQLGFLSKKEPENLFIQKKQKSTSILTNKFQSELDIHSTFVKDKMNSNQRQELINREVAVLRSLKKSKSLEKKKGKETTQNIKRNVQLVKKNNQEDQKNGSGDNLHNNHNINTRKYHQTNVEGGRSTGNSNNQTFNKKEPNENPKPHRLNEGKFKKSPQNIGSFTNRKSEADIFVKEKPPSKLVIKERKSDSPISEFMSSHKLLKKSYFRQSLVDKTQRETLKHEEESNHNSSAHIIATNLEIMVNRGVMQSKNRCTELVSSSLRVSDRDPKKIKSKRSINQIDTLRKTSIQNKTSKEAGDSKLQNAKKHNSFSNKNSVGLNARNLVKEQSSSFREHRLSFRDEVVGKKKIEQSDEIKKSLKKGLSESDQNESPRKSTMKPIHEKLEKIEESPGPIWYSNSKSMSRGQIASELERISLRKNDKKYEEKNLLKSVIPFVKSGRDYFLYASEDPNNLQPSNKIIIDATENKNSVRNNQLFDRISKKFEEKKSRNSVNLGKPDKIKVIDPVYIYKSHFRQPGNKEKAKEDKNDIAPSSFLVDVSSMVSKPLSSMREKNKKKKPLKDIKEEDPEQKRESLEKFIASKKSNQDASTSTSGQYIQPNKGLSDLIIDNRIIGKGSYAVVKTAYHIPGKIEVAVKVYDKFKMTDPRKKGNLKSEVSNLKELDHPGIIKLHQKIEDTTKIYLVMEFGGTLNLKDYLKTRKEGWAKPSEVKPLFYKILQAVDHIHGKNVVHRDLKLQNIVLKSMDNPKIVDFGFSRKGLFSNFEDNCGTPNYMSPELLYPKRSKKAVYSDIWALGIILYYLITQDYPFKGKME